MGLYEAFGGNPYSYGDPWGLEDEPIANQIFPGVSLSEAFWQRTISAYKISEFEECMEPRSEWFSLQKSSLSQVFWERIIFLYKIEMAKLEVGREYLADLRQDDYINPGAELELLLIFIELRTGGPIAAFLEMISSLTGIPITPNPRRALREGGEKVVEKTAKNLADEKAVKRLVYTVTDGPVNLNRLPDLASPPGSARHYGGTFVTLEDLTDPGTLTRHVYDNLPVTRRIQGKPECPHVLTEIEIDEKFLRPDPHGRQSGPTRWIPPGSPGNVQRVWDTFENPATELFTPKPR